MIQIWGFPIHCKTVAMGKELGAHLGTVLESALYDYLEKSKIVKIKILFDVSTPIRAVMYIVARRMELLGWISGMKACPCSALNVVWLGITVITANRNLMKWMRGT